MRHAATADVQLAVGYREPASLGEEQQACLGLWAEVLRYAISDACGGSLRRREAKRWIESNAERVGGFVWICGLFDLEPDVVREKVLKKASH